MRYIPRRNLDKDDPERKRKRIKERMGKKGKKDIEFPAPQTQEWRDKKGQKSGSTRGKRGKRKKKENLLSLVKGKPPFHPSPRKGQTIGRHRERNGGKRKERRSEFNRHAS